MTKKIACLLLCAAWLWSTASTADPNPPQKGNPQGNPSIGALKSEPQINWLTYDQGVKLAKKENKKLFVEFTAKWCGYCKRMRATTFKDLEIIDLLSRYYVCASVDGEAKDTINVDGWITNGQKLAQDFGIRGYPTFWFVLPDGSKIAPVRGYRAKDELYYILDYMKDDLYKTQKFEDYLKEKKKASNPAGGR